MPHGTADIRNRNKVQERNMIMEKIIEILKGIRSDVDFEKETQIVTGKVLDSIGITTLIAELEDEFDIEIGMEYMENANFDSVEAIAAMIEEIKSMAD